MPASRSRGTLSARDVFSQTHDERVLVAHTYHKRGNSRLSKRAKRLQSAFAAHKQIFFYAAGRGSRRDQDRFFETDGLDVVDDFFENATIAFSRIENFNLGDGNHPDFSGLLPRIHATLLRRARSAMPYR